MKRAPQSWQGELKTTYFLGPGIPPSPKHYEPQQSFPTAQILLRIFNEPQMSTIFNVVAAIPGWESDR